jgi:quinol monooxygenase YgiN
MLVQQQVKDFEVWKKAYDSFTELRTSKGQVSDKIFRDESNPNKITVILHWDSLENAKKYAQSPELKAAMQKAGVEGPPQIHFLNEA